MQAPAIGPDIAAGGGGGSGNSGGSSGGAPCAGRPAGCSPWCSLKAAEVPPKGGAAAAGNHGLRQTANCGAQRALTGSPSGQRPRPTGVSSRRGTAQPSSAQPPSASSPRLAQHAVQGLPPARPLRRRGGARPRRLRPVFPRGAERQCEPGCVCPCVGGPRRSPGRGVEAAAVLAPRRRRDVWPRDLEPAFPRLPAAPRPSPAPRSSAPIPTSAQASRACCSPTTW